MRSLVYFAHVLQDLSETARADACWREAVHLALEAGRSEQVQEAGKAMASLARAPRNGAGVRDLAELREYLETLPTALKG